MGPRAGLDRCGKSCPHTGIRSPDRPASSESLCRIRYLAHSVLKYLLLNMYLFLLQNVHSEARRRDCSLCGKVLWSKRAHAIHYRMKHSAASKVGFRCRICQKRFDSKDERYTKHILILYCGLPDASVD